MYLNQVVGNRFKLLERLGSGSFGETYKAENMRTKKIVAVKLEDTKTTTPQLSFESKIYTMLAGGTGIPRLFWYGTENYQNILVIELLGKSLERLHAECDHKFSLKTVLMLADQMIACVEYVHNKNFIHRDIKPDNFVIGMHHEDTEEVVQQPKKLSRCSITKSSNDIVALNSMYNSNCDREGQVFLIDFGLAKKFRDQHTHQHIPFVDGKPLTGTARYASLAAMEGIEQSRRDDMESIGYVLVYFLLGKLPWMGVEGVDQSEKFQRIAHIKQTTSFETLCRGCPREFVTYFEKVRSLGFEDEPDYSGYRQMFRDLFIQKGYVYDYQYDWVRKNKGNLKATKSVPMIDFKLTNETLDLNKESNPNINDQTQNLIPNPTDLEQNKEIRKSSDLSRIIGNNVKIQLPEMINENNLVQPKDKANGNNHIVIIESPVVQKVEPMQNTEKIESSHPTQEPKIEPLQTTETQKIESSHPSQEPKIEPLQTTETQEKVEASELKEVQHNIEAPYSSDVQPKIQIHENIEKPHKVELPPQPRFETSQKTEMHLRTETQRRIESRQKAETPNRTEFRQRIETPRRTDLQQTGEALQRGGVNQTSDSNIRLRQSRERTNDRPPTPLTENRASSKIEDKSKSHRTVEISNKLRTMQRTKTNNLGSNLQITKSQPKYEAVRPKQTFDGPIKLRIPRDPPQNNNNSKGESSNESINQKTDNLVRKTSSNSIHKTDNKVTINNKVKPIKVNECSHLSLDQKNNDPLAANLKLSPEKRSLDSIAIKNDHANDTHKRSLYNAISDSPHKELSPSHSDKKKPDDLIIKFSAFDDPSEDHFLGIPDIHRHAFRSLRRSNTMKFRLPSTKDFHLYNF